MNKETKLNVFYILEQLVQIIILNVLFLAANFPLVAVVFIIGLKDIFQYPLLLLICSIPLGPSLIALFRSTFDSIADKDFSIYKKFFYSYKASFSKEIVPFLLIQGLLFLLSFDKTIYAIFPILTVVSPIYFILRFICLMALPFLSLELALFSNSIKDVLKNVIILIFTKPFLTILTIFYILFMLILINDFPVSLLFFIFSLFAFLFVSFDFNQVVERIKQSNLLKQEQI